MTFCRNGTDGGMIEVLPEGKAAETFVNCLKWKRTLAGLVKPTSSAAGIPRARIKSGHSTRDRSDRQ